jgi:hypothetical protein
MSLDAQNTPQRSEEALELIGMMVAIIGKYIREKDWENHEWFANQLKGIVIASEQLVVEEENGSNEMISASE